MCFTDAKQAEILRRHRGLKENEDVLKLVAQAWRRLSDRERAHWDEEARNDKVRYVTKEWNRSTAHSNTRSLNVNQSIDRSLFLQICA